MSLPEKFGRYEIIDVLGQGAMGLVYKAADPVIERTVAIKVIQADPGLGEADLERMQARFEQEFRSAGALSHSNIVTIFDVGKEGDLYYIAMEFVEGTTLDSVLSTRGVLTFKEVSDLASELSSALDYAHAQGVVHRDIKPANVMLTPEGRAKITDFGLAKVEATTLTRTGGLVGTPAFMSPEQVGGHQITGKSDQFSLAILLYQALTGERPFTGDSPSTIMYKIVHEEPLPPRHLNKSLPEAIDQILVRSLHKDSNQRYPTCVEMADALRQSLGASPLETIATSVDPASLNAAAATVVAPGGGTDPSAATSLVPPPSPATPPGPPQPSYPPDSYPGAAAPRRGVPGWVLGLAIALPSIALLAVVTWLVMSGRGPQAPAGIDEQLDPGAVAGETQEGVDSDTAGGAGVTGDPVAEADAETGAEAETEADTETGEEAETEDPAATSAEEAPAPRPATERNPGRNPGIAERDPAERDATADRGGRGAFPNTRTGLNQGIPVVLQRLMEETELPTGRLQVQAPFPVSVAIIPAGQFQRLTQVLRDRMQNASQEERRGIMRGFVVPASQTHDMELPAGNWRVAMMAPRALLYHEEQVVLREDQTLTLGARIPTEFVAVTIRSEPEGARVRVDGLPPIATPYSGRIVAGQHRFEFIWGDESRVVPMRIDRGGQEVVGRRQPDTP